MRIILMSACLALQAVQAQDKTKPKTDQEIQACIIAGLNRAPQLQGEGFTVIVTNAVATFIGTSKKPGSKGGVYAIASACGATRVINNIVAAPDPKKKK
ncbi:MAG: BON domain-containing protein [Acidobacteria bacterium]|nr:BON domain-containing protein [Acidobacteriota bacterium]